MKPIAIFDIDGTIFRSSLVIELFRICVKRKIFPEKYLKAIKQSELKWLNRQGHYDEYMWDVVKAYRHAIRGVKRTSVVSASREVIREQQFRTYRYTRELLKRIRKTHFTIGISGSPLEVVEEYNAFLNMDKVYGSEYGVDEKGNYTGAVIHEPPRYKKEVILRYLANHKLKLKNSLGIGDSDPDIGILELVDHPIAFNPNTGLAKRAKQNGWTIVIERKDLIVEFFPKNVKFLTV